MWDVTIKTPIGSLAVVYSFTDDDGIAGTATGKGETVPLQDIVVDRTTGYLAAVGDQADAAQP